MSRPIRKQSVTEATSTEKGEAFDTKGHNSLGLFVVARNLDTANDTLEAVLDVTPTQGAIDEWAPLLNVGGDKPKLTADDFVDPDDDGTYSAFVSIHGVPAPVVRARVSDFTDDSGGDLEVDAYVLATGNAGGRGHSYEE